MFNLIHQLFCQHHYMDISLYYNPRKTVLCCEKCGKLIVWKKDRQEGNNDN